MEELIDFELERMVMSLFFAVPPEDLHLLSLEVQYEDIVSGANKALLSVFHELVDQGVHLDPNSVSTRILARSLDVPEDHINTIYNGRKTVDPANREFYVDMLKRYSLIRRIQSSAQAMMGLSPELDYAGIVETADSLLTAAIDEDNSKSVDKVGGSDFVDRLLERINNPIEGTLGIKTGIPFFDITFDGLVPRKLVMIGARPGMGKSALAQNIIANVAIDQRIPVLLIDTETHKGFVEDRLLSIIGGFDYRQVAHGFVSAEKIMPYAEMIGNCELYYHYMPKLNTKELMLICRKYKKTKGIQSVFVDFLGAPETEKGHIELGVKVKDMHDIANILDLSFTVFQQLNRDQLDKASGKTVKEVELGHFAQSDMSTWYPDGIAGIRLPTTPEKAKYGCNRMVDIPKNRFGEASTSLPMRFVGNLLKFEGIDVF